MKSYGLSSEVGPKELRKTHDEADEDDHRQLGHAKSAVTSVKAEGHDEDQFLAQFMNSCVKVYATHVEPNYRCGAEVPM